jgi:hypothetical protein
MDIKWMFIAVMVIMSGMFIGMALEQHNTTQCRIAAIQAGKNSIEIAEICK